MTIQRYIVICTIALFLELTLCYGWRGFHHAYQASRVYWSPDTTTPNLFLPRLFDDKSCYGRSPQKYTMMVGLSPLINQEIHFWPLSFDELKYCCRDLCDRNMACLLIGLFSTSTEETAYVWIHLESYESEKTIHSWHKLQILVTYLDHLKGNPYLNHKSSGPHYMILRSSKQKKLEIKYSHFCWCPNPTMQFSMQMNLSKCKRNVKSLR